MMIVAVASNRPLVRRYELLDQAGRVRMFGTHARPLVEAAVRESLPGWRLMFHGRMVGQAADLGRL